VHRDASCERPGDALRRQQTLRSRQDPPTHAAPGAQVAVGALKHVRQDLGRPLELVEHSAVTRLQCIEEPARILHRRAQQVGRIHHGEPVPGKQASHQR